MPLSRTINELLSLIAQYLKSSHDSKHIPFGVVYHACTSTTLYVLVNKI